MTTRTKLPTYGITCESDCDRLATQYSETIRGGLSGQERRIEYSPLCNVHAAARRQRSYERFDPQPLTADVVAIVTERQAASRARAAADRAARAQHQAAQRDERAAVAWASLDDTYEMSMDVEGRERYGGTEYIVTIAVYKTGEMAHGWGSLLVELDVDDVEPAKVVLRGGSPMTFARNQLIAVAVALSHMQGYADALNEGGRDA